MSRLPEEMKTNLPANTLSDEQRKAMQAFAADIGKALMKFVKGEWSHGADRDPVPLGTRFIANVPEVRGGYRKWVDQKPTDERMAYVGMGEPMPHQQALPDRDAGLWPDGEDPWQVTFELPLASLDGVAQYTYTTSSYGGEKAVKALIRACAIFSGYPGQLSVVELGASSYENNNFGKVHEPRFKIVGWVANEPGAEMAPVSTTPPIVDHQAPLSDPSDPGPSEDAYGEPFPL